MNSIIKTSGNNIPETQFKLTVDGELWKLVTSLDSSTPDDTAYVVRQENDGTSKIIFGDGKTGRRPHAGANIQVAYRYGAGATGAVGSELSIFLEWTSGVLQQDKAIEVTIEPGNDGITFRPERASKTPRRWKWTAILCRYLKRWAQRLTC